MTQPNGFQFRPRARIIRTIGDQLISGAEAAVIELVKNAYDADAARVDIVFRPPLAVGQGSIAVSDDGHGMTLGDIQDKWMEPATSSKVGNRKSRLKGRAMMGSKGIGRFAAAKLGGRMLLRSISDGPQGRQEILVGEIAWSDFSGDKYLSEIVIPFSAQSTAAETGSEIQINDLAEAWSEERFEKLVAELRRLISPLVTEDASPFQIFLDLSALTKKTAGFDGDALVNGTAGAHELDDEGALPNQIVPFPVLKSNDYELVGQFDASGAFEGTLEIRRGHVPPVLVSLKIPYEGDEESCGPFSVHFYVFDREADSLKRTMGEAGFDRMSTTEARNMIDSVAGVAVYRSGFRVRPYGDLDHDWLTLDRRRVQDPTLRIGHNQIAGYVTVESEGSLLIEKSSREGFEENGAFRRLQRLLKTLLAEVVEPQRRLYREKAGISRIRKSSFNEVKQLASLNRLRKLLPKLGEGERAEAEKIIETESQSLSEKISVLEDRQRILEARSSLGSIIVQVLHEGRPQVSGIFDASVRAQALWIAFLSNDQNPATRENLSRKLGLMKDAAQRLNLLFDKLQPLVGARRGISEQPFSPLSVVTSAKDLMTYRDIPIRLDHKFDTPDVLGFKDDLSTAVVNLLENATHWLQRSGRENPEIVVSLSHTASQVRIVVTDNGPGISSDLAEAAFEPGFTLKDEGTGLGLSIAREALARSHATLIVNEEHVGGAQFIITMDRA